MQLSIVKIGGGLLNEPALLEQALGTFANLPGAKALVHGGGRAATELAHKLGIESPMVDGRRITSPEMLEIVVMVYGGLMNRQLVASLQHKGVQALGLTGADLNLILAHRRAVETIDYGLVGDVDQVNAPQLHQLLQAGLVPILAPITHDGQGQLLNTNADTIASTVAQALTSTYDVELIYAFERPGVLADAADDRSVIPSLTPAQAQSWQQAGVISGGMLPKLHNAWQALAAGVKRVVIGQAMGDQFQGTTLTMEV